MKLEQDRIVLESRYEIDDILDMIDCYETHLTVTGERPASVTMEELNKLKSQLDVLYLSW